MSKGLTSAQRSLFWRTFSRACDVQGLSFGEDREAYRKRLMQEECEVSSMADLNRTTDFDKLMLRLAVDAEDYDTAAHYEVGTERRIAYLVEICAVQVMQLKGGSEDQALAYILGIVTQAGYDPVAHDGTYWLDVSGPDLAKLFAMLDTHRRRLLAAAGWQDTMPFSTSFVYSIDGCGNVVVDMEPSTLQQRILRVA